MPATLDIRRAHMSRVHGDITAVFSWINDERALFLIPTYRKGAPWFIVCESAAYTWDDSDPKNIATVVAKAMKACDVLGIEPSPTNARRIAGIVIDSLPELIRMPTSQPPDLLKPSFGHMELRQDGQLISGQEIRLEDEGAEYA